MQPLFDPNNNKIFFGSTSKLDDWLAESSIDHGRIIDKIRLLLKNYLELDNVSFLFGSGTSIHLGAVAIRNFPKEVEDYIIKQEGLEAEFYSTIESLQAKQRNQRPDGQVFTDERGWNFIVDKKIVRDNESKEIAIEYEKVLNYLIAKDFVLAEDKSKERVDKISELIIAIKEGLFNVCNLEKREVSKTVIDSKKKSSFHKAQEQGFLLEKSRYIFHEKPLNLRRANIFTANYDLAFEYSFDKLGVHYIDGFAGFHKRFFQT
jgi:hypothetical protein